MSEAYAWFGAAYFFYDMWSMYRVHAAIKSQHLYDKIRQVTKCNLTTDDSTVNSKLQNRSTSSENGKMYEKKENNHNGLNRDDNSDDNDKQVFVYDGEAKTSGTGFAKYILSNPVMTIHHIFIGSFGLAVIAVSIDNK